MKSLSRISITVGAFVAFALFIAPPAEAGCGCQKPPPDPAPVRPNATYPGTEVTLFNASFQTGQAYFVDFTSGTTTATATVSAGVVNRRDLADGVYKPQLVVVLPGMPLGPTSIRVRDASGTVMLVNDDAFTVVPLPVAVPQEVGGSSYPSFTAAVGRDRTFYISLDMTAVTQPRVFRAQAQGYPLVFTSNEVVFYNTQGFHMQLLGANMPGLYSVVASNSPVDSDILGYSRHEFNTFYLQHEERQVHQIVDGNWHVDGTRHVDHDHLIVAITGVLYNGSLPVPGATPPFTLRLERSTLFHHGLVGTQTSVSAVALANSAVTDSYDSRTGLFGHQGDVRSNGRVNLSGSAVIDGDATAFGFDIFNSARITGVPTVATQREAFMSVKIPDWLTDLGQISLTNYQTQTIGPGSYKVSQISLTGHANLYINNCTGPVTVYVTGVGAPGSVDLLQQATLTTCTPNPELFAVYSATNAPVTLQGGGTFHGVVYAPQSLISINNTGEFFGSFVAGTLQMGNQSRVHYDVALKGPASTLGEMTFGASALGAFSADAFSVDASVVDEAPAADPTSYSVPTL